MKVLKETILLFVVLNIDAYLISGFLWHNVKDIWYSLTQRNIKHCSVREIVYDAFLGGNPYIRLIKKIFCRENLLTKSLTWERNEHTSVFPAYRTAYNNRELVIRVNNFPEEHLYTLMEKDKDLISFDDWPKCWHRDYRQTFSPAKKIELF